MGGGGGGGTLISSATPPPTPTSPPPPLDAGGSGAVDEEEGAAAEGGAQSGGVAGLVGDLKAAGGACFQAGGMEGADWYYSRGIAAAEGVRAGAGGAAAGAGAGASTAETEAAAVDELLPTLYSNRSAARCELGRWGGAATDADACLLLRPGWAKGHLRKGGWGGGGG